jgi:2-polyprenyl-6-methoxyphenol hydroxylase-like FAD-dependent oxidoreductase
MATGNAIANGNTKHHATDSEWGQIGTTASDDTADDAPSCNNSATCTNEITGEIEDIGSAVAIIGGGIAGFALAAGLSALNVPFVVYERAPQLRSQSQGMLVLRASGYRAMESIDPQLATLVSREGVEFKTVHSRIISVDGGITEREILNMKEMEVKKSGVVTIALKWNVLQSTLSSTVPKEVIKTGHSLTSFKELDGDGESGGKGKGRGGGVLLTFDNGKRVRCRALLGCDGTFSRVRKQMYDPKIDPVINYGMVNWSSILPQVQLPGGKPLTHTISAIVKSSPPAMGTFLNQCGDDQVFWQIRITDPKAGLALSANEGRGGLGLVGAKEKLLSVLSEPGMEELAGAVAATPEKDIFERCILVRQLVPGPWTGAEGVGKGRVTLVGDTTQVMNPGAG